MQSKGFIKLIAILFALASLWQLSFTFVAKRCENKAEQYAKEQLENATIQTGSESQFLATAKNLYLDSLKKANVYMGYTYKEVKAKELNLGLDLKGGMSVTLEIQVEDLVRKHAPEAVKNAPNFNEALEKAIKESKNSSDSFIDVFAEAFGNLSREDKKVLEEEADAAVSNAFQVLNARIDRFGVSQPNVQRIGNSGRILVELPGVKEPERVRKLLQTTASLEFWECYICNTDPDIVKAFETLNSDNELKADPNYAHMPMLRGAGATILRVSAKDTAEVTKFFNDARVTSVLPNEFIAMWSSKPDDNDDYELYAIKGSGKEKAAKLDGSVVTDARVQYGAQGKSRPEVSMSMNGDGARKWANITREAAPDHRQIAIVLDRLVYSCPRVNGEITGGSSSITGDFSYEEAEDLANILKSGKLDVPAKIMEEAVVGPTLGANSIKSGMISFIIAFILVLLYMILFYRRAGTVANVALLCNVLLLFGFLVSFGAVLTLPGIAGLVLTMGMAVDANVIIFERIKEELAGGKALGKAIDDGFKNAYSAIVDGQITTLLTGIVLFVAGSGPIKGFATTLIFGIISSVLTAIFIPRLIFSHRVEKGKNITFESKATKNFLKNTSIDFIGKRKYAYICSGAVILICLGFIFTKGFSKGIDFTGGSTYVVKFDKNVNVEDIRKAVNTEIKNRNSETENSSAEVKQFGSDNQVKITTAYMIGEEGANEEIENILCASLASFYDEAVTADAKEFETKFKNTEDSEIGIISSESVGPTIANEVKNKAVVAVIIALIVIFAYIAIRFRKWTWGLGGVVSLAHTALIVIGFFSIFSGVLPFTLDVDMTFIAAVLTIIGYAINDNVVIFDRIREYKKEHPKGDFKQNVNLALNATLSRTMNTSLTTLVTMLAIAIFGGEVIRGLAVALIVGIIVGTYASLFIGTTIMYDATVWSEKKKSKKN